MALPLTKDWLVNRYLTGIDLTDDAGTPYPDELFTHAIAAAVQWAARVLDLELEQRTVTERHDWDARQWAQWAWISLARRPLLGIDSMRLKYANQALLTVPAEWIVQTVPEAGTVQLIPLSSVQGMAVTGFGVVPWLGPGLGNGARTLPGYYEVTYRAGFPTRSASGLPAGAWTPTDDEFGGLVAFALDTAAPTGGTRFALLGDASDGAVTETVTIPEGTTGPVVARKSWPTLTRVTPANLPPGGTWTIRTARIADDVLHLIGMYASCFPLNTAGDLVAGAGVASRSIGIDGLTSSVSTTASATNAGYGARILQYQSDIKRLLPVVRNYYHGIELRAG